MASLGVGGGVSCPLFTLALCQCRAAGGDERRAGVLPLAVHGSATDGGGGASLAGALAARGSFADRGGGGGRGRFKSRAGRAGECPGKKKGEVEGAS